MQVSPLALGISRGTVTEFDQDLGLGHITSSDGTQMLFHCISLTDGSRSVAVGRPVSFRVYPGMKGHAEAGLIEKL